MQCTERYINHLINPPLVAVPINCWVCGEPAGDVYWPITNQDGMKRKVCEHCERRSVVERQE